MEPARVIPFVMEPGMRATFIRLMEELSPSPRQLPIKDKRHSRMKTDSPPRLDFRKARLRVALENTTTLVGRLRCDGMRTSAFVSSTSLSHKCWQSTSKVSFAGQPGSNIGAERRTDTGSLYSAA